MFRLWLCYSFGLMCFCSPLAFAQSAKTLPAAVSQASSNSGPVDEKVAGTLPPLTKGLADKAAIAMSRNEWKQARKYFLEILEIEPSNVLTLANLGAVEHQLGMLSSARQRLELALAINPKLQQSWLSLGLISMDQGDAYFSVSCFSRAVHEDPTDARPHQYLALSMKILGWVDAAEAELQRAIELNPKYATAYFNLALMNLDRSPPSLEMARRNYQKSVELGGSQDPRFEERLKELSAPTEGVLAR